MSGSAPEPLAQRLAALRDLFRRQFGAEPALVARAPGRVNLIGEHTDYNDGYVFPIAIERDTLVAARPRADRQMRVYSATLRRASQWSLDAIERSADQAWSNYVRGLARYLLEANVALPGADLAVASTVPLGAGVSSSAALEMATGTALLVPGLLLRRAGARRERDGDAGVGAPLPARREPLCRRELGDHGSVRLRFGAREPCVAPGLSQPGLRACAFADRPCRWRGGHGGQARPRRFGVQRPPGGMRGGGASAPAGRCPQIRALRDVSPDALAAHAARLPDRVLRRSRHVVGEISRVQQAVAALRAGDLPLVGDLMYASHASLRDDYEVSVPELDFLVEAARGVRGVVGSRMTGGGFGGSTVTLMERRAAPHWDRALRQAFRERFGRAPTTFISAAAGGAGIVWP